MFFIGLLLTLNLSCATSLNPNNLKLDLIVPNEPFFAGEIVYLEARLKNFSNKAVTVKLEVSDTLSWNYEFRVQDAKGDYVDCAPSALEREHEKTINAGESYALRLPFYLCTKRDFNEDKRYSVKALFALKGSESGYLIESEEKWVDVLVPKTEADKAAYRLLYTFYKDPDKGAQIPHAYSSLTAYKIIPDKYPTSLYVKYALFAQGKSEIESDTPKYIQQGIEAMGRLLREYPAFHLTDETLYYLGLAHQKLGEKEKALEFYNKAVKEYSGSEGAEMASKAIAALAGGK